MRQRAAFGARPPSFQHGRNSDPRQGSTNDEQEPLDNEEDKGSKRTSYEELRRRHRDRQYQGPRRMPAASEQQVKFVQEHCFILKSLIVQVVHFCLSQGFIPAKSIFFNKGI